MDRSGTPKWGLNREPSGEFMPTLDFAGADRRSSSVRGGGETQHRLSERRGAAISSLEIPSPIGSAGGSDGFPERRSPGSRSPAGTRFSPHHRDAGDVSGKSGARRAPAGGSGRGGLGKKGKWRARIKLGARFAVAFALLYYFGRTTYQLTFFAKAGLNRYVYHPLYRHRPIPCGVDTPPTDPFLAPLARRGASPKDVDDGVLPPRGRALAGSRSPSRGDGLREVAGETDAAEAIAETRRARGRRAGPGGGETRNEKTFRVDGEGLARPTEDEASDDARPRSVVSGATSLSRSRNDERLTGSESSDSSSFGTSDASFGAAVDWDAAATADGETGGAESKTAPGAARRFAILTLCDANAGYICAASAANKRRYADLHGYDLIVSRTAADPSRPAAWSKILEVRKHLPRYDWLMFIDVDTLIMNPAVRLEDVADDSVDQVLAADHNGVNSGVWMVRNTPWSFTFLDELWAQDDLVKGPYLFHYEQRAFHRLFHTDPWSKQPSTRGAAPYAGAAEVRAHSKIVNQCVFNSLLPWYVSGDFVVHFAGLKGVWECFIFFSYFDASQEMPGMRVSDEQWARELGGQGRGRASQTWQCMQFKTLFR